VGKFEGAFKVARQVQKHTFAPVELYKKRTRYQR